MWPDSSTHGGRDAADANPHYIYYIHCIHIEAVRCTAISARQVNWPSDLRPFNTLPPVITSPATPSASGHVLGRSH